MLPILLAALAVAWTLAKTLARVGVTAANRVTSLAWWLRRKDARPPKTTPSPSPTGEEERLGHVIAALDLLSMRDDAVMASWATETRGCIEDGQGVAGALDYVQYWIDWHTRLDHTGRGPRHVAALREIEPILKEAL